MSNTQIIEAVKDQLQQRISRRSSEHYQPMSGPLCVSTVAVVPRDDATKDADNLVKGLLDTLIDVVVTDDRHIQCLTSRRMEWAGEKGHYLIFIRQVEPWDADVVWDDPSPAMFANGERIEIG